MFLSDYSHPVDLDEKSLELRKNVKAFSEYGDLIKMPKETIISRKKPTIEIVEEDQESEEGSTRVSENEELAEIEPTVSRPSSIESSIFNRQPNQPAAASSSKALSLFSGQQNALTQTRSFMSMPKPQWHAPWKLYRVISGHLGWVRCIDVDPSNEWFVTGSNDRIIKIWDLASGTLKLSLTGHVSTVRGVCVSSRHPYLFSCGEDKQVKCWDLETNKVIRHYHGHLSACYGLALHPALDILVSCGRDSVARVNIIFPFYG
jgi:pleiotropic regulator 1